MHVLIHALQAGNRSGTGRYVEELVYAVSREPRGYRYTVVWPYGVLYAGPESGVNVIRQRGGLLQRSFLGTQFLEKVMVSNHADLLHHPANFGAAVRRKPMVLTVHDLSFMRHPEWFRADRALYYRHAIQSSVHQATRIVTDSRSTAEDLCSILHYPESRIDVVPLGVGAEYRRAEEEGQLEVRRRYGLPERFFLYMGTLEPRKNLVRLVKAWSRVSGTDGPDLVLAGRCGWKNRALDRAISASSKGARIHRPGFIEDRDLSAVLSSAQAFVWPSLFEGFGLPPLESMACGTPVLASNTSSMPEVLGDAALLVDPLDEDALADGLSRLAEDAALRGALREKGFARAAQYTWARTAAETLASYQKTLLGGAGVDMHKSVYCS